MRRTLTGTVAGAALASALLAAAPAFADVKAGVDAWSRGDYAAAVREWQGPAEAGDVDAMFNLAQAYRLGRGVPLDADRAEQLYARAAAAGHAQAADTYGLMLFQDGRREAALPYVEAAARRGDPRSQYLLGIAHFNGDLVPRDWVRAYALVTLANGAALPQAVGALAQMDQHIPLPERQEGARLAEELRREADVARASELLAADLAAQDLPVVTGAARTSQATPRVPGPIPTVAVSPSVAAARQAVAEASRATGTESPATAGASYSRSAPAPAGPPAIAAASPTQAASAPRRAASPASPQSGPWRVQLGAFSVAANAHRLWDRVRGRRELAGAERLLIPAGRVTKLQAAGFASRAAAERACRALADAGHECLVTRD